MPFHIFKGAIFSGCGGGGGSPPPPDPTHYWRSSVGAFQDDGGITPASVGDPVGLLVDQGTGGINIEQSGAEKPIRRVDGIEFVDAGDLLELASGLVFTAGEDYAISFLAFLNENDTEGMICGGTQFIFLHGGSGFRFRGESGEDHFYTGVTDFTMPAYYMFRCLNDGSGTAAASLFKDGVLIETKAGINNSFLMTIIGQRYSALDAFGLDGKVDDLAVWRMPITDEQAIAITGV